MLTSKRAKFSLPKNITYLNCAYMSPLMKSVEKAGIRGLRQKRNPAEIFPDEFFANSAALRAAYAKLIGATQDRIAIIPSVSYGMAAVAANLRLERGQNIIVAAEQFPSNYYVWQRLCDEQSATLKVVSPPAELADRGRRWNERILEAIDASTRAVAIAHTHWADGTRFDLSAIRKHTKDRNALLIVDGTQSVGALPFDCANINPDALICAGYKWLLGPYSIALAYFSDTFSDGRPIEETWIGRLRSEDFSALVQYNNQYQPGATRFDVGERANFILVPMLLKAIEQIDRWGVDNIQQYCAQISGAAIEELRSRGFWIEDAAYRASHLFGLRVPSSIDVERIRSSLQKNKIHVSFRGSAIRVSPNVYNDASDLKRLVKALTKL